MAYTPPSVSLFTRFVLENPWPLAIALGGAGAIVGWTALRDGQVRRLAVTGVLGALALALVGLATAVTTSGEHAVRLARAFADAARAGDLVAADALLAPDASLALASPSNPGFDRDFLMDRIAWAVGRYPITDLAITSLDGYTVNDDRGEARLDCRVEVENGWGPTGVQLLFVARPQSDGAWRVSRVVLLTVQGQSAQGDWLR